MDNTPVVSNDNISQAPVVDSKKKLSTVWILTLMTIIFALGVGLGYFATLKYLETKKSDNNGEQKTTQTDTQTQTTDTGVSDLQKKISNTFWYADTKMGAASDWGISFYEDGTYILIVKFSDIEKIKFDAEKGTYKVISGTKVELTATQRIVADSSNKQTVQISNEVRDLTILSTGTVKLNAYEGTDSMKVSEKYLGTDLELFNLFGAESIKAYTHVNTSLFTK